MPSRSRIAAVLLATLFSAHAPAQTPADSARIRSLFAKSPTDRIVDQLVQNAEVFRTTLPSLTARESIESGVSGNWLFKRHAKAEATMRVARKTPGGPLEESREITIVDGKRVKPGKHVDLPTLLIGGFGSISQFFFTSASHRCFDYTLTPKDAPTGTLALHIAYKPGALSLPNCPVWAQRIDGTAIVGSETHQLMHLEFTIPNEDAKPDRRWPSLPSTLRPSKSVTRPSGCPPPSSVAWTTAKSEQTGSPTSPTTTASLPPPTSCPQLCSDYPRTYLLNHPIVRDHARSAASLLYRSGVASQLKPCTAFG